MNGDDELTALRRSQSWRVAVWGLRILLLGLALAVVAAVTVAAGASSGGGTILTLALIPTVAGVLFALLGVATVTPKTSRYTEVSSGSPSTGRAWQLIRALISDVRP